MLETDELIEWGLGGLDTQPPLRKTEWLQIGYEEQGLEEKANIWLGCSVISFSLGDYIFGAVITLFYYFLTYNLVLRFTHFKYSQVKELGKMTISHPAVSLSLHSCYTSLTPSVWKWEVFCVKLNCLLFVIFLAKCYNNEIPIFIYEYQRDALNEPKQHKVICV